MNQLNPSTADSAHVCTLDAMCAAATARLQQGILQAASAAYIALDIEPPDSHVIEVLMTLPGLAGVELTDAARGE